MRNSITQSLKLPENCFGDARVTLIGNKEAWIENYKGILEYKEEQILLQTKTCRVAFLGKHLSIEYYTGEDMKIKGVIAEVRYGNDYV